MVIRIQTYLEFVGFPQAESVKRRLSLIPLIFQEANYDNIDFCNRSACLEQLADFYELDCMFQNEGTSRASSMTKHLRPISTVPCGSDHFRVRYPGSAFCAARTPWIAAQPCKTWGRAGPNGQPLILLLTPGQIEDHKGARLMLNALPQAKSLTGDRGYDSDWFRKKEPQSPAPLQRGAIQKAPQKSKIVLDGSKIAQDCNALRSLRPHPLQHLHRRQLDLLSALIILSLARRHEVLNSGRPSRARLQRGTAPFHRQAGLSAVKGLTWLFRRWDIMSACGGGAT